MRSPGGSGIGLPVCANPCWCGGEFSHGHPIYGRRGRILPSIGGDMPRVGFMAIRPPNSNLRGVTSVHVHTHADTQPEGSLAQFPVGRIPGIAVVVFPSPGHDRVHVPRAYSKVVH